MNRPALLACALVCVGSVVLGQQVRARAALAADGAAGESRSVEELRTAGPSALAELLSRYDRTRDPGLIPSIDAVAGQKDAVWSRLYWYTDLASAKTAAATEHKPILYLRLLGKLTDEYSCANSRFFRTVLYANGDVSKLLREKFVLVWESERPVPVVTIDYGDGRVLKRTLTGNSIHYVLSPDGAVVDALPGLYDPVRFKTELERVERVAVASTPEERRAYTVQTLTRLLSDYQVEAAAIGAGEPPEMTTQVEAAPSAHKAMPTTESKRLVETRVLDAVTPTHASEPKQQKAVPARIAADRAMSKMRVEQPLVQAVGPAGFDLRVPDAGYDAALWPRLARRHLEDARLDANSVELLKSQNAALQADAGLLGRTLANFQQSVAEDTVRNNYDFRPRVLIWMIEATGPLALEDLNRRVYAELFLTPRSDPWLGLVPEATYSALGNEGCVPPVKR